MSTTRVVKTAAATLTHTFLVDETLTNSTTTVTVSVTDANGAVVASGNATNTTTGTYTFALPAQSQLALLTAAWSATIAGAAVVENDTVEICGGFLFTLAEGRAADSSLKGEAKYPTSDLKLKRQEVEEECEWICDRAFVPRYRRVTLNGTGTPDIVLPDGADEVVAGITLRGVRTIRSAKVAPRVGQTFVALTATELAALVVTSDGSLRRADGKIWTEGVQNVIIEYEYGSDIVPADLKRAMLARLRSRLNLGKTQIPERAMSFTAPEGGGTYRLSLPDAFRTGVPDIDAAYARYSRRVSADAAQAGGRAVPASRTLHYDPQYHSLYHGGRR